MTTDLHSLLAPYVLDALDPDERNRFEAHLGSQPATSGAIGRSKSVLTTSPILNHSCVVRMWSTPCGISFE